MNILRANFRSVFAIYKERCGAIWSDQEVVFLIWLWKFSATVTLTFFYESWHQGSKESFKWNFRFIIWIFGADTLRMTIYNHFCFLLFADPLTSLGFLPLFFDLTCSSSRVGLYSWIPLHVSFNNHQPWNVTSLCQFLIWNTACSNCMGQIRKFL